MSLADSLRVLLEHGLIDGGRPISFTGGCFPAWRMVGNKWSSSATGEDCPAWKVVKHYFTIKVVVQSQFSFAILMTLYQ